MHAIVFIALSIAVPAGLIAAVLVKGYRDEEYIARRTER